jgi:hypothetical protein
VPRFVWSVIVLSGFAAWGQRPIAAVDCDDAFAECKEDCTISFGGTTQDKARAKINACLKKCSRIELDCRDRFFEAKRNDLDEGAIKDPSVGTADRDELRKKRKKKPSQDEDLTPLTRSAEPAQPAYELKPEETPKSDRTQLTRAESAKKSVEEKPAAPAEAFKNPVDEKPNKAERAEKPKKGSDIEGEIRAEPPKRSSSLDGDVRSEEEKPKRVDPPKKKSERREEKKPSAIDEWDPDAL